MSLPSLPFELSDVVRYVAGSAMLRCHCGFFVVLETTYFHVVEVLRDARRVVGLQWPEAAHPLTCHSSEHCVGGRRLFTNCLIEVGLIDVL